MAEPSGAQGGRVRTTCKRCGAESLRFTDPDIPAYQQFDDVDFALWSYPGIAFCVKTGLDCPAAPTRTPSRPRA